MLYFTINELCRSQVAAQRGIDNTPTDAVTANLRLLINNVLDPLREAWGRPLTVSSGYRSKALNKAVGGVSNSQHLTGQAADIVAGSRADNYKLFKLAISLKLPYDQLIFEKGTLAEGCDWVHISFSNRNRRQILYLTK
jgi:hypothetical protein